MTSTKRTCLICTKDIQKNNLITHIAEHLNYKRHKCLECSSQSVLMEIMVDHQTNTNHKVQFDVKNWYLDRVCQLIYNDFEYAQKNGEHSIREFGSVFGDKKRLTEMLRACELKEDDDDIEVISTHEVQNASNHTKMSVPLKDVVMPLTDPVRRLCDLQANIPLNNATNSDKQQDVESIRPVGALMNVQTAPADSSNEHIKVQTTEQILVELQRQISRGLQRKMCKICHQMVDNDYKSQKEHVKERHLIGSDEKKKETKLRLKLEQCFKQEGHLLVTNDFQCNICGRETKYRDTRYHHVSTMHTDYQWNCVYPSCDFVIRSKRHFNSHLNNWHKMNLNQLEGEAKDRYIMMNSDFEQKLTPLVRKCFPFDLTSPGEDEERKRRKKSGGTKGREDELVDSVVSSFMPTVDRPALNRSNSESSRKNRNSEPKDELESSSDSECTDSERKSKSTIPKDTQKEKKMDKFERSSASTAKHQWTKNERFDNAKTPSTSRSSAAHGQGNGSFYSSPRSDYQPRSMKMHDKNNYRSYYDRRREREHYESPLRESRLNETKKLKVEKKNENVVYFRR